MRLHAKTALVVCVIAALAMPDGAQAAFPGQNGKIAFSIQPGGQISNYEVWSMNPDGTSVVNLTNHPNSDESPVWSPDGTKVAFMTNRDCCHNTDIYTMNADGTSQTNVTFSPDSEDSPAWSPDGTKLVFVSLLGGAGANLDVYSINADGSGRTNLTNTPAVSELSPAWSPDGTKIAFNRPTNALGEIFTMNADGTNPVNLTNSPNADDSAPAWSPDGAKLLFFSVGASPARIYTMNPDGTNVAPLTGTVQVDKGAAWSPDGTKIVFFNNPGQDLYTMNVDGTGLVNLTNTSSRIENNPDWQSIPITAYSRPRGATPFRISLVPAFNACTAPNRAHGAPLSFGSCAPPGPSSTQLTIGTPDANGQGANSEGFLLYGVVPGDSGTPADEADVSIVVSISDVRRKSDLTDYTGELQMTTDLRITDKDNTPAPGGPSAGTVQDRQLAVTISCASTASTTTGANCNLSTTFDALIPGVAKEGRRAIWQLGQVRVRDGDSNLFLTQGVFIP
jgi:Tol biopolymer transport system component